MADQTWTLENIEFGTGNELRVGGTVTGETDRRICSRAGKDRLRRSGNEFNIDGPAGPTAHAKLRLIGDRPLGAQVEWSAPTSLADR